MNKYHDIQDQIDSRYIASPIIFLKGDNRKRHQSMGGNTRTCAFEPAAYA
jgi:hypothetical protein